MKYDDFILKNPDCSFCCYDDEGMLIYLLQEDVLFCNSRQYLCVDNKTQQPETIVIFVNCNDVWFWACADAEEITLEELPELCRLYMEDSDGGVIKWACQKRNMRPQAPIRRALARAGETRWMDELDPNPDEDKS